MNTKKKLSRSFRASVLIMGLLCLFSGTVHAQEIAGETEQSLQREMKEEIQRQLNDLDLVQWEVFLGTLSEESRAMFPGGVYGMLRDYASGSLNIDASSMMKLVLDIFLNQMRSQFSIMIQLLAIAFLSGIISRFTAGFENKSIREVASLSCYAVAVVIMAVHVRSLLVAGQEAIRNMSNLLEIAFPLLLMLLAGTGGITATGMLQPTAAILSGGVSSFLRTVVMPMALASFIFYLIDNLSDKVRIGQLGDTVNSACKWLLGSMMTVYVAVLSLQGIAGARFDSITYRTAKYAVRQFIPVVGSMFSDSMNLVVGCTLLIQNAAGLAALVLLIMSSAAPLIQILASVGIYKLTAALIQPIGDPRMVAGANAMSQTLLLLFLCVLVAVVMFVVTLGIAMGAGSMIVG